MSSTPPSASSCGGTPCGTGEACCITYSYVGNTDIHGAPNAYACAATCSAAGSTFNCTGASDCNGNPCCADYSYSPSDIFTASCATTSCALEKITVCATNSDCPPSSVCAPTTGDAPGMCVPTCTSDSDCAGLPFGYAICKVPEDGGTGVCGTVTFTCTSDSDCAANPLNDGKYCYFEGDSGTGTCATIKECTTDSDCSSGQVCTDRTGVSACTATCTSDSDCASNPPGSLYCELPGDGGTGFCGDIKSCATDWDCPSPILGPNGAQVPQVCNLGDAGSGTCGTKSCTTDADCAAPETCVPPGNPMGLSPFMLGCDDAGPRGGGVPPICLACQAPLDAGMGNGEAGPAPTREAGSTSGDAGSADATTPSDAAGGPSDGAADATAE